MKSGIKPFEKFVEANGFETYIQYKVHGYWSKGVISIHQHEDCITGLIGNPDISYSAGGRDRGEEPDQIVAVECFIEALKDATEHAKELLGRAGMKSQQTIEG